MNYLISFLIFALCFILMAIGLIVAKKVLRKGCSMDPEECLCKREGRDPEKDGCAKDSGYDENKNQKVEY